MRIYIATWEKDPHTSLNPYVCSLTDEVKKKHQDVIFEFGKELLWEREVFSMDIIHIMWPHCWEYDIEKGKDLEQRLIELKENGTKIISTCHNLHAHVSNTKYSNLCYEIVYRHSDIFIHLGRFSLNLLANKYPKACHVLIPHHIYDTVYSPVAKRNKSIKFLRLPFWYKYVLCLGAFRNDEEKEFVKGIGRLLKKNHIMILAPSIMKLPYGRRNPKVWLCALREWWRYFRCGIVSKGRSITNDELPYYCGTADIVLIQRPKILNSGNLSLGLYMGKVVVGPDVGNVGEILRDIGNPVFIPSEMLSVVNSILLGIEMARNGKGKENKEFSIKQMSTEKIAECHYKLYQSTIK